MNVFSFLLSGASFATTILAPSQWLVSLPSCLPLLIQEDNHWQSKKLEGVVRGNEVIFTPLSLGEVNIKWEATCNTPTEFQITLQFPEESFAQGVFEQEGWHSQYISAEIPTVFFQAPGLGKIKLFLPTSMAHFTINISATSSFLPSLLPTFWVSSPWKVVTAPQSAFFSELRTAVTGNFPSVAETTSLPCHTQGDLLAGGNLDRCRLARLETVATSQQSKLYVVNEQAVSPFSPTETFVRPNTQGQVVISEVMWPGSYYFGTSLQSDQWIELYNPTNDKLNLVGARLRGAKPIGDIIFFNDFFIPPKGYIIIGRERGSRTSLARDPDKVELLALELSGRSVQLISYQGVMLDQTPLPPWPAGNDNVIGKIRSSMQRLWSDLSGLDPVSWGDCSQPLESYRCRELSESNWRSKQGENLGTPWQQNVL